MSKNKRQDRVKKPGMSASSLKMALITFVFLAAVAIPLASWFGIQALRNESRLASSAVDEANAIDQTNLETLNLWKKLNQKRDVAEKARKIVADSQSYSYQDVIVRDLDNLAKKSGIRIIRYDFVNAGNKKTKPGADRKNETPKPKPVKGSSDSSLKTVSVNVSIEGPVSYYKLLRFINYIEQNSTKMQLSGVSIYGNNSNRDKINTEMLTIEVYVR